MPGQLGLSLRGSQTERASQTSKLDSGVPLERSCPDDYPACLFPLQTVHPYIAISSSFYSFLFSIFYFCFIYFPLERRCWFGEWFRRLFFENFQLNTDRKSRLTNWCCRTYRRIALPLDLDTIRSSSFESYRSLVIKLAFALNRFRWIRCWMESVRYYRRLLMELVEATRAMTMHRQRPRIPGQWESFSFHLNRRFDCKPDRGALSGASGNKSHIMTLSLSLSHSLSPAFCSEANGDPI